MVPSVLTATSRLLACVIDINNWMSSNRLKLNGDKTEFIWLGTRTQLAKVNVTPLVIKGQSVTPSDKVRDLGVIIDNELKVDDHVRNVVRRCFYQLRQLRSVRQSLTTDTRRLPVVLWHPRSLPAGSTIAILSSTEYLRKPLVGYRWC